MTFIKQQFSNSNNTIMSPPITPKQHLEPHFGHNSSSSNHIHFHHHHYFHFKPEDQVVQSNWTSPYTLPPSPPPHPLAVLESRQKSIMAISSLVNETSSEIITSRTIRKQRNPVPSPSSFSTRGAFNMPFIVNFTDRKRSSLSCIHEPVTNKMKRKYTKKASPSFSPYPSPAVKQTEETPRQRPTSSVRNANTVKTNVKQAPVEKEDYIIKRSTEAALVYDELTADFDVAAAFKGAEEWIPTFDSFNRKPCVRVQWRGHPLKIKHMPYYDRLHRDEASIAATLRLTPEQYLKCKWALILAAKNAYETKSLFRKSEAQKVCCIDVNKTSVLWNAFGKLGWLGPMWPQ